MDKEEDGGWVLVHTNKHISQCVQFLKVHVTSEPTSLTLVKWDKYLSWTSASSLKLTQKLHFLKRQASAIRFSFSLKVLVRVVQILHQKLETKTDQGWFFLLKKKLLISSKCPIIFSVFQQAFELYHFSVFGKRQKKRQG